MGDTPLQTDPSFMIPQRPAPHAPDGRCTDTHLAAILDHLDYGLLSFDARLNVRFVNASLTKLLGLRASTGLAEPLAVLDVLSGSSLLGDGQVARAVAACTEAIVDRRRSSTLTLGAMPHEFELALCALGDDHWLATFQAGNGQPSAEVSAIAALRDPLTDLPNRRAFDVCLGTALASAAPESIVLLVDLDRFKHVNDTLGHPVGDGLLCLVAKRLRSLVRTTDFVARFGGDEFAVVMSPVPGGPNDLARRIVDVLGRPYLIDGHLVTVGASVGIASAPGHGQSAPSLVRCADLALYAAKAAGRGAFRVFEPELDQRANDRRTLEIELRRALVLREFELHYQPQIDIETQTVEGFEALIRWNHPGRGLIPPSDFIPLAEEIGLIVPLGEWVIRQSCMEAMRWPNEIRVAVNISSLQFADADRLVNVITHALATSGLPGQRLEIEITESVLLRDQNFVLAALHQLHALGVRVAMDDFGTGYSSLSQLRSFPFDKIKIDRSFVHTNDNPDSQNAIVRAITALGMSLGMQTIAEGVETPGELERVRSEGCRSVQGYLFSRPVPSSEITTLLRRFATPIPS